jgi:probable F420-dependent oxidoreductase
MRIEAFTPQGSWKKAQAAALQAELAGFDSFASPEIAHDPFMPLAAAALSTERIGLRTAIAVAFPRSPMVVANTCWDLQRESQGRFALGLGTQVKPHNERRFSVKWQSPRERLREYVLSLRAIWRAWEKREKLKFEGEHYQFTLMTPEFSPEPTGLAPVPVYTAAVGPRMLKLAGEICDGVRLHGFATRKYVEQVALPAIAEGLAISGRARANFEICGGGFICTGPDDAAVRQAFETIRYRVAFYGSTPSYQPVFAVHGLDDLGTALNLQSRKGAWDKMAGLVSDEVVHLFTAVARYDGLKRAVEARFGGISDCIELGFSDTAESGLMRELLTDLKSIEAVCKGVKTSWQ